MVAASPRPAVVDDSTDTLARARGRGGGRGRGGQSRPLGPSRGGRRPPPHGSSSLAVALPDQPAGDLPGGSRRPAIRGSIRGRSVGAPRAAMHVHPSGLHLEPSVSSSHSSVCPAAASGFSLPGSRPPALPALTADERLRRRREIRQGKRPVAGVPASASYQSMDFHVHPPRFPEWAHAVQAPAHPATADPLSFDWYASAARIWSYPTPSAVRKLLLIAVEEGLSFFASVGNLQPLPLHAHTTEAPSMCAHTVMQYIGLLSVASVRKSPKTSMLSSFRREVCLTHIH